MTSSETFGCGFGRIDRATIQTKKAKFFNYVVSPNRDPKKNSAKVMVNAEGWFRLAGDDAVAWPAVGADVQTNSMCELKASPADVRSARSGGDDFFYDANGELVIDLLLAQSATVGALQIRPVLPCA